MWAVTLDVRRKDCGVWGSSLYSGDKQDLHCHIGHTPPKALFPLVYVGVLIPFLRASQAAGSFARLPLLYPSQNTVKRSLLALLPTFKPWNRNCFPEWPGRVLGTRALPCLSPQVHPLSCLASSVLVCLMTVEYVTEWTMSWFICGTLFNCVNVKKSPQGKPRGTSLSLCNLWQGLQEAVCWEGAWTSHPGMSAGHLVKMQRSIQNHRPRPFQHVLSTRFPEALYLIKQEAMFIPHTAHRAKLLEVVYL